MLEEPQPILVTPLFPHLHAELLSLLKSLSAADWQKATACPGWSVKDVALHLLGGEIGNLSRRRDGTASTASIHNWGELVSFVNDWNRDWVSVAGRISPRLLIDLLALSGSQMCAYFAELDPFVLGDPVNWVGPDPAPVWLDLAREYTERWHHQQHIRDAVGKPGLKEPVHFAPVLQAFMRALPRAYSDTPAADGTCVSVTISGPAGGRWSILRREGSWVLYSGAPASPQAEALLDQETAWRLFTRGLDPTLARAQLSLRGDPSLAAQVLEMVSIIA